MYSGSYKHYSKKTNKVTSYDILKLNLFLNITCLRTMRWRSTPHKLTKIEEHELKSFEYSQRGGLKGLLINLLVVFPPSLHRAA